VGSEGIGRGGKLLICIPNGFGKGVNKSSDKLLELIINGTLDEVLILAEGKLEEEVLILAEGKLEEEVLILVEGKLEEEVLILVEELDSNFFANNIFFPTLPSIKTHFLVSECQIKSDGRFLVPRDSNSFNFFSNNIRFPASPSINTQSLVLF
jgi:hypothetical protein